MRNEKGEPNNEWSKKENEAKGYHPKLPICWMIFVMPPSKQRSSKHAYQQREDQNHHVLLCYYPLAFIVVSILHFFSLFHLIVDQQRKEGCPEIENKTKHVSHLLKKRYMSRESLILKFKIQTWKKGHKINLLARGSWRRRRIMVYGQGIVVNMIYIY